MLKIHYVHWNGTCEIITSPAKTQIRVKIPSNALLMMTVHKLIKAYGLLPITYHLPPTTYRLQNDIWLRKRDRGITRPH